MPRDSTAEQWIEARERALKRAFELTKRKERAKELVHQAIMAAIDPDQHLWDPERQPDLGAYLCSLVWSIHGNELQSFRVTNASDRLDLAPDRAAPSSGNPERLLAAARTNAEAAQFEAAVARISKGDALVTLLLESSHDALYDDETTKDLAHEPASTRRALAKGYSLTDVRNARKRLQRYALSAVREIKGEARDASASAPAPEEAEESA